MRIHVFALIAATAISGAVAAANGAGAPNSTTLDRIQSTHRMRIGYRSDAKPFAYTDPRGQPDGYAVALCRHVAEGVQAHLRLTDLPVDWVRVDVQHRFDAVSKGEVDMVCGPTTVSLERRKDVSFSIPIFPGGISALVRTDAPARLKDVLSGRGQPFQPTWRASAAELLQFRSFATVGNTTTEAWLRERIKEMQIVTKVVTVATYREGVHAVLARSADALFGERAILLDSAKERDSRDLVVLDRQFTYKPLALVLPRDDEPFRLVVDRTLAQFYAYNHIGGLYTRWFGEPDENTIAFFRWSAIPE